MTYRLKPVTRVGVALISGGVIAFFSLEPILQIALTSSIFHLVPSNARSLGGLMIQMTCQTFSVELFDLRCGSPAACVSDPWPNQLVCTNHSKQAFAWVWFTLYAAVLLAIASFPSAVCLFCFVLDLFFFSHSSS